MNCENKLPYGAPNDKIELYLIIHAGSICFFYQNGNFGDEYTIGLRAAQPDTGNLPADSILPKRQKDFSSL